MCFYFGLFWKEVRMTFPFKAFHIAVLSGSSFLLVYDFKTYQSDTLMDYLDALPNFFDQQWHEGTRTDSRCQNQSGCTWFWSAAVVIKQEVNSAIWTGFIRDVLQPYVSWFKLTALKLVKRVRRDSAVHGCRAKQKRKKEKNLSNSYLNWQNLLCVRKSCLIMHRVGFGFG